ncbi:hypothetical protein F4805DRAFT_341202 [Annulohypoxylon moriforme]|nr:hypothetical protein F4805DRAFT_341202 [Annulohypoxylon moriforme]
MSERPYNNGLYPGQQGQQPHSQIHQSFPQSFDRQPPAYHQPPYATLGNYATVNNSYQYNASSIPGLGMGNFQPPVPYGSGRSTPWNVQTQDVQHQNRPAQTPATNSIPSKQGELPVSSLEEGELSEGEFEDLYEPKDTVDVAIPASYPRQPSATENPNGSVGDADGSSIYDGTTPQGETAINSTSTSLPAAEQEYSPGEDWEPDDQERERSGSYSPYLSPREIQRRASVSKPIPYGPKQTPNIQPSPQSLPGINMSASDQPKADATLPNGTSYPQSTANGHDASPSGEPSFNHSFQSVAEAKKKAQEAILGLWPLKVRYQDYIEEGFDEKLIRGLFTDLGLEASIPKPTMVQKPHSDSAPSNVVKPPKDAPEPQASKDRPSAESNSKQTSIADSVAKTGKDASTKSAQKTAAEERKDKIARKLAARAQRTVPIVQPSTAAPPSQPTPATVSVNAPASMSPAKPKTRAENNAILHQKLAALKKAQEKAMADRKSAAGISVKPATPPAVPTSNSNIVSESKTHEDLSSKPPVAPTSTTEQSRRSASTEKGLPKEGGIPGLFLATQLAQQGGRNLKRPVASDFDNYSSPAGTLKRSRTQEPLIIDVSDDEDVEMDIGSPIDEPNSSNGITNPPSGQTPLGTFPPLSNSPSWKQRSSPGSSAVPTPPVHGVKLNLLNKRIEEAKRQIAEAEAKKAAKRVISQSPQAQRSTASTPPQRTYEVSDISDTLQKAKRGNVERRDRIVSFELPIIEADLEEKQERLRQAVAQAAQLELEIQTSIEERRKLTAEMEELADSSGPMTPETSATTTIEPSHVEPQHLDEQQSNTEAQDALTTAGQNVNKPDQGLTLNDVQPNLQSSRATSPAGDQHPVDVQLSYNPATVGQVLPASPSNQDTPSESASADMVLEDSMAEPNAMVSAAETQEEEQDHDMADIPEQLPQISSPSSDGSYRPQSTPISPIRDAPLLEPERNTPKAFSLQEDSIPLNDKHPAHELLDDIDLYPPVRDLTSPLMEKSSGEVQNSSSHEHPLLTATQDEPEQKPQVEDLLSYNSPLGYFRAYRFHPKYFDEVAGGLKSMTYSSRIDPMRPICPRVLAGEQCPDGNSCEFQHFESMVLPGES